MKNILFVLGAADPEMMFVERVLRSAGLTTAHAMTKGKRVTPANAYVADDCGTCGTCGGRGHNAAEAETGGDPHCCTACGGRVALVCWIECRPAGWGRAGLEDRGDYVVDHHNPGDRGFGLGPERAFEASSVEQVAHFCAVWAHEVNPNDAYFAPDSPEGVLANALCAAALALRTPTAQMVGVLDHNLSAALAGRAVVDAHPLTYADPNECLRVWASSWEDAELAALLGRATIPADEVLKGIVRDREALRDAPSIPVGGVMVADLTELPSGTLQWAPVAACVSRRAYLALAPSRPGVPPTVALGGATTSRCVEVFMDAARRAVSAHRDALERRRSDTHDQWMDAQSGPADEVDAQLGEEREAASRAWEAFEKACSGARGGEGVYGDPARGFAGTYAPIALVRKWLTDAFEPFVVIHGSAVRTPGGARDVDVIVDIDCPMARESVRRWAEERGLEHLPLDVHASGRIGDVNVPLVPGASPTVFVVGGRGQVWYHTHTGIASQLRRTDLTPTDLHAEILRASGWRLRVNLEEDARVGDTRAEWEGYVDGRRALASGIRCAKRNGRWEHLMSLHAPMYTALEAVAEYGSSRLDPATVEAIRRGSPCGGAALDINLTDFRGGSPEKPNIGPTHGACLWQSWEAMTAALKGEALARETATREAVTPALKGESGVTPSREHLAVLREEWERGRVESPLSLVVKAVERGAPRQVLVRAMVAMAADAPQDHLRGGVMETPARTAIETAARWARGDATADEVRRAHAWALEALGVSDRWQHTPDVRSSADMRKSEVGSALRAVEATLDVASAAASGKDEESFSYGVRANNELACLATAERYRVHADQPSSDLRYVDDAAEAASARREILLQRAVHESVQWTEIEPWLKGEKP